MPGMTRYESAESRDTSRFATISPMRAVQFLEGVQVGADTAGESLRRCPLGAKRSVAGLVLETPAVPGRETCGRLGRARWWCDEQSSP